MCLKNKIIAGALCLLIAGIGIFGINGNNANAQTTTGTQATIEQLQQIILGLQQQIAQIIEMLSQRAVHIDMGSGGGGARSTCTKQGGIVSATTTIAATAKCCGGFTAINNASNTTSFVCAKCGNGSCGKGETATNCPTDCNPTTCIGEGSKINIYPGAARCCAELTPITIFSACAETTKVPGFFLAPNHTSLTGVSICTKCGNGICGIGENKCNCPADCTTIVGGRCNYKKFAGKCTIMKVENASITINVGYSFTPTRTIDISGIYLTDTSMINPYNSTTTAGYLGLPCLEGQYAPTLSQTTNCGVVVGAIFNCELSVIKTGICTPINVKLSKKLNGNGQSCVADSQCAGKKCLNSVCCNANQCGNNKTCYNNNATTTIDGVVKACTSEGRWIKK